MRALIFLLISVLIGSCSNQKDHNPELDKQNLIQAIEQFNIAFRVGDANQLAGMISKDYLHTNGTSRAFGGEGWLNYLRNRQKQIEAGELIIHDYQMSESKISMHGESAIVTARIDVSQTLNNKQENRSYRVTNVWVKENNEWKRAGFHDRRIDK